MAYRPENHFEKILFWLAGEKSASSKTLPSGELNAVVSYWLMSSNTAAMFSTILLTLAVTLFIEIKSWVISLIPFIGAVYFFIRNWVCTKCAQETLALWK